MYYIGLDVHKRTISYCVKDGGGAIYAEGTIPATRFDLDRWMKTLPQPWTAALKVAHPLMLRAIAAAKKKNDRIDASKICDCLRCDFLPECYMASTRFASGGARCGTATCWSGRWEIGTKAERPTHAAKNQKEICTRAPPKRGGRALPS
jgi:hypothetical protein